MRWQSKNSLRIENARLQAQAEGYTIRLRELQTYVTRLESLVEHERDRIDAERSRADRSSDALLQQNGIAPVSEIGVRKAEEDNEEAAEKFEEAKKRIGEFYAENIDDIDSDSEISPEIKAMLAEVKSVI